MEYINKRTKWKCDDCGAGPCILEGLMEYEDTAPDECPFGNGDDCKWELLKEN